MLFNPNYSTKCGKVQVRVNTYNNHNLSFNELCTSWSICISSNKPEDSMKPGKAIQQHFLALAPIIMLLKYQSIKQLSEMSCNVYDS